MGNIVLLDDLTINKIAAGEVIERPASVIKEMMENSIDAGATAITVEMKNGGISYIRITDNGKGIAPDDMEIAFERHATSKIRTANDLTTIRSMGFRGEALASIAAISNVEMISRQQGEAVGNKIVVEAGKVLEQEETGCAIGTTITVQNLFFNTPVRYKFLKKDYTESGYIEDIVTRIALVNPHVAVKLINTGKTIIQTTGNGNQKDVIYSIYGKDNAQAILEVTYQYEDIKVVGVIGKPEIARSNRGNQIFFVNQRYVKDKTLQSAAEQGYKGMLPIGKYGFLVLNVALPSDKVDVNVHPAKLEVRFEEEQKVFKAVYHAIKDTLLKGDLVANTEKPKEEIDFGDLQEEKVEEVNLEKQKPNFIGLFNKIRNMQKTQPAISDLEAQTPNALEEIYQSRTQPVPTITEEMLTQKQEMQEDPAVNTNFEPSIQDSTTIEEDGPIYSKTKTPTEEQVDIATKIIELQNRIKEEVEKNPNLKTTLVTPLVAPVSVPEMEETKMIATEVNSELEIEEIETNVEQTEDQVQDNVENSSDMDETKILDVKELLAELDSIPYAERPEAQTFEEMYVKTFGKLPPQQQQDISEEDAVETAPLTVGENLSVFEQEENYAAIPNYKFIGIAFSTYIIIEMDNEIYIIDQHAAHERIMYEKVKANFYDAKEKDSQLMLLPDIITLTHKEMDIARENIELFEQAGFMIEEFGENTIKLTGAPTVCMELDTKELFLETLDEINTVARTAKQEKEEKFIATIACKAAVKANMALSKEEVDKLMEQLLILPNPFTCPHGRPTAIKMTKYDIEKKFSRR